MKGFHLLDDTPHDGGSPRCVRGSDSDSGDEAGPRPLLPPSPARPTSSQQQHTTGQSGSLDRGAAGPPSTSQPAARHAALKAVPARRFNHTRRPGRATQQLTDSMMQSSSAPAAPPAAVLGTSLSLGKTGEHCVVTRLHAAGICCPMESRLIHRILDGLPGVVSVQVTVVTKVVAVQHDPAALSPAAIAAALNGAGLQASLMASTGSHPASPVPPGGTPEPGRLPSHVDGAGQQHQAPRRGVLTDADWLGAAWAARPAWTPPLTVVLCGFLLLLSFLYVIPHPAFKAFEVLALLAAAVGVPPVLRKAYHGLRAGLVDMNTLLLVALVGAAGLNDWSEAGTLVFLFTLAEWLEERCVGRAAHALEDMLRLQPEQATLILEDSSSTPGSGAAAAAAAGVYQDGYCDAGAKGGVVALTAVAASSIAAAAVSCPLGGCVQLGCCTPAGEPSAQGACYEPGAGVSGRSTPMGSSGRSTRVVAANGIAAGMLVLVRPGDKVPVDGVVEKGASVLDESMLTGESRPVTKQAGSQVMSGTVNCGSSSLEVRASAAAADSTVARLSNLIAEASAARGKRDRFVESFAKYYTPAVTLLALAIVVGGVAADASAWRHWCYTALVVLVTACPCALVISTPVASVAGIACAAKKGVLIKGSRFLELLGSIRCISFDKSGTLTQGHFQIMTLKLLDGRFDDERVLRYAAALEQHSSHPLSPAVVGYAAAQGCLGGVTAQHVQVVAGKGVFGEIEGHLVAVGSWKYAQDILAQRQQAAAAAAGDGNRSLSLTLDLPHSPRSPAAAVAGRLSPSVRRSNSSQLLATEEGLRQGGGTGSAPTTPTSSRSAAGLRGVSSSSLSSSSLGVAMSPVPHPRTPTTSSSSNPLEVAAVDKLIQDWGSKGASTVCVLVDGQLVALLVLSDQLRDDAYAAVAELQALGCYTAMLSGDNMAAATAIALQLGMEVDQVFAELLPADKLQVLTMLQRGYHTVAHVGDGINDAPALAAADVGVAMGVAGSALAVDTADVALFTNDLRSLVFAVCLGRRVGRVVVTNITLACLIKVGVLVAAAGGFASLWLSLLADVGASLLVTLHALTLLHFDIGWHPDHVATPGHSPPLSRRSSESSGADSCKGPSSKPLSRLTAALRSSVGAAGQSSSSAAARSRGRRWWPTEALQRVSAPFAWWRSRRYVSLSGAGGLPAVAGVAAGGVGGSATGASWRNTQKQEGLFRDKSRDLELGGRARASPVRSRSGSPATTPRKGRTMAQSPQQQQEAEGGAAGQRTALLAGDRRVPPSVAALFVLEDDE